MTARSAPSTLIVPGNAFSRLETLVLMAGLDLPVRAIRQQISGAINVIVHIGRLADGSRRIMSIVELTGFDYPTIGLQELFVLEATGGGAQGRTRLTPTGIRPQIMDKSHRLGVEAPETAAFRRGIAGRARHARHPDPPPQGGREFFAWLTASAAGEAAEREDVQDAASADTDVAEQVQRNRRSIGPGECCVEGVVEDQIVLVEACAEPSRDVPDLAGLPWIHPY